MKAWKYYLIMCSHVVLLMAFFLSPFFLSWKWVLLGVVLYYLQNIFIGCCILTLAQFEGKVDSFCGYYLSKWGLRLNKKMIWVLSSHVIPWILFWVAFIYQHG